MKKNSNTKKFADGGQTDDNADTAFTEDANAPAPEKKDDHPEPLLDEAEDKLESLETKIDDEIKPAEEEIKSDVEDLENNVEKISGAKEEKDRGLVYFVLGGLLAAAFGIKWGK